MIIDWLIDNVSKSDQTNNHTHNKIHIIESAFEEQGLVIRQANPGEPEAKSRGHRGAEAGLGAAEAKSRRELLLDLRHEHRLPDQLAAERSHDLGDLRPFLLWKMGFCEKYGVL